MAKVFEKRTNGIEIMMVISGNVLNEIFNMA